MTSLAATTQSGTADAVEPSLESSEMSEQPQDVMQEEPEAPDELELERRRRYEDTERELLAVLDAGGAVDEPARKRQLVGLFDRFRSEYAQLSGKLRESLRLQRRLMDKCLQMKNELVVCALKIKTTQQVQADEIKSLIFYRDECEHAWKQSALSQERERNAMRIIDELKAKIEELQMQVKTLVTSGAPAARAPRRRPFTSGDNDLAQLPASPLPSPKARTPCSPTLDPTVTSPSKRNSRPPSQSSTVGGSVSTSLLSFDEWKIATKIWSPATPLALGAPPRTALTPSLDALQASQRQQEVVRCASVPSLQPTPMERVSSPQQQQSFKPGSPASKIGADTSKAPQAQSHTHAQTSSTLIARRGGTPAIKRRAPRQLPIVR